MSYQVELLARTGGSTVWVASSFVVIGGLCGAIAAFFFARKQEQRSQDEFRHAKRVFDRLPGAVDDNVERFNARPRRVSIEADPAAGGLSGLAHTARQEAEIYLEHHRLALRHHSAFQQASLWSGVLGFSVVLVGAVLTYFAGLDVGAVTAAAGFIPTAASGLLFRQANLVGERAAENLRGLEDSVRRSTAVRSALAATAEIGDKQARNRMHEVIALHLLFPSDDLDTVTRGQLPATPADEPTAAAPRRSRGSSGGQ
ncbi:hypothetical protein SAMN04489729_2721 [Amycolatopsis lurida]|uniref:Cyanobacterial TRADD-N associated 2 transmembrane domain-containing protein n=1 Tax=Amycolatopsis lurida NRRL 2430 TaxID=1460371 RepID=A0A2P2FNK3_AMYLU|nr:hypothetical protein [Amycolatopsis lurida]KFU78299.1 hypothetical protein BB31_27025 [Amycolatopsis lurida NRRL 2430]SEC88841.1 hypothetical protein SAMN04489729_2721 [Amycolatopsis lurida]